jgi:hypothetical protein
MPDVNMVEVTIESPLDESYLPLFDAYVCSCGGMWRMCDHYVVTVPETSVAGLSAIEGITIL